MTKLAWSVLPLLLLFSQNTWGKSLSYSTDFDGTGSGAGFAVTRPDIDSSSHGPRSSDRERHSSDSSTSDQEFLRKRYQEQLLEAKKRAEEEALREQIERARLQNNVRVLQGLLEKLQQLEIDEPSILQRMKYTQEVLDLEKQYEQARTEYMATLPSYRERLAWSLNHIVGPPPLPHPLHYRRILIWGFLSTPDEARQAAESGIEDPFSGEPFDNVFAFGTKGVADLARVSLDYLLGHLDRLSPDTTRQIGQLKGATADEVVCHSNGCRIAQVLIATGMLKVNKLRVLGGDGALMDLGYLKTLIDERKLQEVSVYAIRNDIVPNIDLGWKIMDLTTKIGRPLQSFQGKRDDLTYQVLGLTEKPKFNPDVKLQVHVLSFPAASDLNIVEKHRYESYRRVVKGWRMSGCLTPAGAMSQHCIMY